ncbi:hypothetical protein [Marinilactibacillus psychrotolerans]|uniref:DUF340 domain-containing protein n=1 Tax=Marinilactibacillus psychrotolerans TaxID=191770 RepID=A0AAV3WQA1_9LACT|nr:hypothetical protein [Marinilactibacillus psychrotolerans]GEL67950.1 hypothetical protein MPS01_21050 [Marinilactibacillus psychrotolerans]GEQ35391.1 hypothetical protein M132T_08990 [Marinilactibacillus psychrotolerans]SDD27314.1 Amino acid permease [Marinilactibacillus psychrotolerans]
MSKKVGNLILQFLLGFLLSLMMINVVRSIDEDNVFNIFISVPTLSFLTIAGMTISNHINYKTSLFYKKGSLNIIPLSIGILISGGIIRIFFPELLQY